MQNKEIFNILEECPVILGIKNEADVIKAQNYKQKVVFTFYGDISTIIDIIKVLKNSKKIVFVNVDMVSGFSSQNSVIDFLKHNTQVDGIISTKPHLLKYAKKEGLFTIHRFFILDSDSWRSIESQIAISKADAINIAPGWTKVINWTVTKYQIPVIGSGLICDKETVMDSLKAGALAICTTNHDVWKM
jgi:glycerol uptake operon antiterminator